MTAPKLAYGRRPDKGAPRLDFTPLLRVERAKTLPIVPASEDYLAKLSGWLMLGNDAAGNCEAVRWANARRLITTLLTATGYYPSQDDVWAVYKTQNPKFDPNGTADTNGPGSAADGGMDTQTLLEHLHAVGGPDGVKVVAFGTIDPTNIAAVEAAIAVFGGVWLDILVLDDNQQQFSDGKPWTNTGGKVDGGHAVLGGGYVPQRKFITWAAETELADSFWNGTVGGQKLVQSVWVVVWPEHYGSESFLQGVDQAALAADYQAITGKTLPAPQPTPTPPPTPAPAGDITTLTFKSAADVAAVKAFAGGEHVLHVNVNAKAAIKRGTWS